MFCFIIFYASLFLLGCQPQREKDNSSSESKKHPPNLVIVMVDDMGWADVGFNGCQDIPTPNIDKIANEGVRFTEAYVTFPVCGPSRAGFLTGRYQDRFGFTTNPSIDPKNPIAGLSVKEETMAQVLKKADYKSAVIGKWHMGSHPVFHPLERGFDYFYGFLSGGHRYFPEELTLEDLSEVKEKWQWYRTKIIENRQTVETKEYLTDEFTNAAVGFIKGQAAIEQHFMLYLAYNAPHTPMQASEKYLSRFPKMKEGKRKTYAAMVSAVDDGVGRVLQAIEEAGIDENTVIVFLSDNGGAKNNASDYGELRGAKGDLFDGGLRVPFAMRWSGTIPSGQTFAEAISSLDVMATIVDLNEIPIDENRTLDGVNLLPYVTGKVSAKPHDYLFWRKWEKNAMAIRHHNFKVVANQNQDTALPEMYDMRMIGEQINISENEKAMYESLRVKWREWDQQMKDREFPTLGKDVWWGAND